MNIKTKFVEFLNEANTYNDKHFYDLASSFFEKMIIELNNNNFIIQNDGNILFEATNIDSEYNDLWILFVKHNNQKTKPTFGNFDAGYAIGKYKQYRVIVINNLKDDNLPSKNLVKSSFIHEFIHYLDFKRSNGYKPDFNNKTSLVDYYNEPFEYNAYYQEAANFIVDLFKDINILNQMKERYHKFEDFSNWMFQNVFDKEFIKYINDKNKIKIKKRIYGIYSEYFKNN